MPESLTANDPAFKQIAQAVVLINSELSTTTNLLKPMTNHAAYKPHAPAPIGMHGTALDEIASALRAIHINLATLNKMVGDLVSKAK